MHFRFISKFLFLFVFIGLWSCIEEDESLVNPPPQSETVRMRFFNLASDYSDKIVVFENQTESEATAYGTVSVGIEPPADSIIIGVKNSAGSQEMKTRWRIKLIRETNFTVFYYPNFSDSAGSSSDTVYVMASITGLPYIAKTSYIKLCNMYADENVTYSLNIGCQNGETISSNLKYGSVSAHSEIRSDSLGGTAVSLTRTEDGIPVSTLYNLKLLENHQYAVVVYKDKDGEEAVRLLDEFDTEVSALEEIEEVTDKDSYVRIINASKNEATIKNENETLGPFTQEAGGISDYNTITVCQSNVPDTLNVYTNGVSNSSIIESFKVLQDYSVIVYDHFDNESQVLIDASMLVEPVIRSDNYNGYCVVRVAHCNYNYYSTDLNVALGARDKVQSNNLDDSIDYIAGEKLAPNVSYGEISEVALIPAGPAPIAFYTSTNPDRMIYTSYNEFEEDKDYLIIITNNAAGEDIYYIVESKDVMKELLPIEESIFMQLVNARYGQPTIKVRMGSLLTDADVYYEQSLSTILPSDINSVEIDGASYNFTTEEGKRTLVIACGNSETPDVFHINSNPMGSDFDEYKHRVINACSGIPKLTVRYDSDSGAVACGAEGLEYKIASPVERKDLKKDISLYFLNAENNAYLARRNLARSLGKNYTLIFAGKEINPGRDPDEFDDGYTVIELQEF